MPCPFYGKSASELFRILTPSGGNQCALVTSRHAPCALEIAGDDHPELKNCEWSQSQRAIEFERFPLSGSPAPLPNVEAGYPD